MVTFDRAKLARIVDWILVAIAVALPWSTSAVSILVIVWLLLLILTLSWADICREVMTPAGGLPVLLFLLGVCGMAWADVSLLERWRGLDGFLKLLTIPLLIAQGRRSENTERIFLGFLASCFALLIASFVLWAKTRNLPGINEPGVPVKSYIVQSAEFTLCALALLYLAVDEIRQKRFLYAAGLSALSFAFLYNIFFVATGRTTLVVIPALLLLYGLRHFSWKGVLSIVAAALIAIVATWATSNYVRDRTLGVLASIKKEVTIVREGNCVSVPSGPNCLTSPGERILYWLKSIQIISDSPIYGHGTGSINATFRRAAVGETGVRSEVSSNPHNQTFAVAIQLGALGTLALWAMWVAHLFSFRENSLIAWIGLTVVMQNIVGSLFNSFLFDFTEGWLYVIGFGVAAGMVRRHRDAPLLTS